MPTCRERDPFERFNRLSDLSYRFNRKAEANFERGLHEKAQHQLVRATQCIEVARRVLERDLKAFDKPMDAYVAA